MKKDSENRKNEVKLRPPLCRPLQHSMKSSQKEFFWNIFAAMTEWPLRKSIPKGPKIENIQDRPPGLKISSEIENFKRTAHETPIFVGNSEPPGLNISSKNEFFIPLAATATHVAVFRR